jgi:hypothetical protein
LHAQSSEAALTAIRGASWHAFEAPDLVRAERARDGDLVAGRHGCPLKLPDTT